VSGRRTPNRQGYRSGYYGRTLITRVGKLELRVPHDRQGRFRTEIERDGCSGASGTQNGLKLSSFLGTDASVICIANRSENPLGGIALRGQARPFREFCSLRATRHFSAPPATFRAGTQATRRGRHCRGSSRRPHLLRASSAP